MEDQNEHTGTNNRDVDIVTYSRWVDKDTARGLTKLILNDRKDGTQQSPLPDSIWSHYIPRFLHFDTPIPGMIYVFGGRASKVLEPEHYLDTAECFDSFRQEWITLPSMNTKRVGAASIFASNDRVYVIGGYSKHPDKPLASGECFNPRTGEWTRISDMSQPRFGHAVAACGKYIYVLGGDSRRNLVTDIERYDIEEDSWMRVGVLPRPVAGGRMLERNGKLYLIGGDIGSQPLSFTSAIRVYDPLADCWKLLDQTLEKGRSACAVTWCGENSSQIAVIGGYAADNDSFYELSTSEIVETEIVSSNVIREIPPLLEPRAGCRAVTIGSKIYVVGGESPEVPLKESVDGLSNAIDQSVVNGLFTQTGTRSIVNVRELLLQALQQRLEGRVTNRSVANPVFGQNEADIRVPQARLPPAIAPIERKPHPNVAVFDTKSWKWEDNSPIMTTARTAASVCVGIGYCTSYGWNTERRWLTRDPSPKTVMTSLAPSRPQAASG